ncbi:hypothetical protein TSAR_004283 [Trichomalopsis sarcophagae]|uniref:Uncharacterized protein n=1 Tax=Trichomalopsis sarcophagae TaxID=543379 RepID=A0A232EEN1_9HYME|nr:hypothetical protein TSAR_004283 [Trichomalopsis sarcophagae]
MLQEYRPMREFYKGIAKADDDSVGLVFIHDNMLEALSECTQLFCDGTFDVCISNFIYFYHIDVFYSGVLPRYSVRVCTGTSLPPLCENALTLIPDDCHDQINIILSALRERSHMVDMHCMNRFWYHFYRE